MQCVIITQKSNKDWQRGAEIQDYNYLQSLKQYQKNLLFQINSSLNSIGEQQALQSEQDALREAFALNSFNVEVCLMSCNRLLLKQILASLISLTN